MTHPTVITTQLKCPNCGQTGILAELQDQEDEPTGAHITGFSQEGTQAVCRLCSHTFPIENPN
jgi:hypothetical protein